ncbi:hypothetical protein ACJ41O_003060 [Fusarium nematophilum]
MGSKTNRRKKGPVVPARSSSPSDQRQASQPFKHRTNRGRRQRRYMLAKLPARAQIVDEDGDIDADTESADEEATPARKQSDSEDSTADQDGGNGEGGTTRRSRKKMHVNKHASSHREVRNLLSQAGDLYNHIREWALELGAVEESEDGMDWQPEPMTPVYLVRMVDEVSCYPDGAVVRPWENAVAAKT